MRTTHGRAQEIYVDPMCGGKVTPPFPHLLLRPPDAWALLVLAHGAGAGMRHRFMEAMAERLARRGVATLRFEFPYWARGSRRVDPPAVLEQAVRDAVSAATGLCPDLPCFAGGKSLGGRMTTRAAAAGPLDVRGIVLLGFPLHPAKRPGIERAEHLIRVPHPMLFLQGTRDALADLELLGPVLAPLRDAGRATLHVVEGADHGFDVLRRSGRTGEEVLEELGDAAADWMRGIVHACFPGLKAGLGALRAACPEGKRGSMVGCRERGLTRSVTPAKLVPAKAGGRGPSGRVK